MGDLTSSLPAADLLVRRLHQHGVRAVFGYPGGQLTPIYDALYRRPAIRHYLARHEQARRSWRTAIISFILAAGFGTVMNPFSVPNQRLWMSCAFQPSARLRPLLFQQPCTDGREPRIRPDR
jgi:glyoxylate carboligase